MRTVTKHCRRRQCYRYNQIVELVVHCFVLLCVLCYSIASAGTVEPAEPFRKTEEALPTPTAEPIVKQEPSATIEPATIEPVVIDELTLTEATVKEKEDPEEDPVPVEESKYPRFTYSKGWDVDIGYLLAKMAMAEAESCSVETKELVILTILNRVWSDSFPDTVEGVIFQKVDGVAQFTPTVNGRWDRVEPDEDCWTALHNVETAIYDKSQGCTFFESCANPDNWHSRNLVFLFESDGMRFYKAP